MVLAFSDRSPGDVEEPGEFGVCSAAESFRNIPRR
jgi:hypothetical protein